MCVTSIIEISPTSAVSDTFDQSYFNDPDAKTLFVTVNGLVQWSDAYGDEKLFTWLVP